MAAARLFLVSNPLVNAREDFDELARFVAAADPEVEVTVVDDAPTGGRVASDVRALTVSPAKVRWFRPPRGPVLDAPALSKSEEYARLDAAGVPVPRWTLLTAAERPALDGLGRYVVAKPDRGARGAEVRILRADHVRWRPPATKLASSLGGVLGRTVLQQFIYTGPWPASYRVATLFGTALYAWKVEASHTRAPLVERGGLLDFDGVSIISSGKGCTFELVDDADVLALAERAHRAFPDAPLLGVDLARERATGALYVLEVNSLGFVWHFSSLAGRAMQAEFGLDLEGQRDGRRLAARVLAAVTRERAR